MIGFFSGSTLGALALGVALEGLAIVTPNLSLRSSQLAFALFSAPLIAIDLLAKGSFSPIGWSRQTCASWVHARRNLLVPFAWGVDLGLGVTTFRVSSAYWIALLGCVLFVPRAAIPVVLTVYATTLTTSIAVSSTRLSKKPDLSSSLTIWSKRIRIGLAGTTGMLVVLLTVG